MLQELFDYQDYRVYLRIYFKSLPKGGFGQLSKVARALDIQPSLLTGILQGAKNLTPEQALELTHHLQMSELEAEYFTLLVQYDRAGTERLRERLRLKLTEVKAKSELLKNRLPPKTELPEQVKAQFYSQWFYSAVRMATSIDEIRAPEQIAEKLGLSRQTVIKVLELLVLNNVVENRDGIYRMGAQSTHVGAGEMLVSRHHTNWRLKAIEKLNQDSTTGLHFTSPLSISQSDLENVRKILAHSIDAIFDVVDPSPAEEVACLCIDWFKVTK